MSDHLPEEILIGILVKLPVKSLIRATNVCKQWRCLIRSPSFISVHLSNSENQALLRRVDTDDWREHYTVFPKGGSFGIKSSPEIEFPFRCRTPFFRILGSCGGLVCLADDYNPSVRNLQRIIVWNPAIRNHVVLPQPLVNPDESDHAVLGFGVASNVFKVVRLVHGRNPNVYGFIVPLHAEIFSVGTGRWRKLSGFDFRLRLEYSCSPVFFKGFVHWSGTEPMGNNRDRNVNLILRFHVGDEVFGETMLPQELERIDLVNLSLAIMGESLGAIKYNGLIGNIRMDVWVMKDYGVKESWTWLYKIDAEGIWERAIGFMGSGEALLVHGFELNAYNPETKGIKHVEVFGIPQSFHLVDYKESLVLLGGYSGDSEEELSRGES